MDDRTIQREIAIAFEYSYLHDAWVNPLSEALDGLTVEHALWRPMAESKCIWEIVLHLTVWHENIVERVRLREAVRPAEGHWPALPASPGEAEWEAAKARLWASLDLVRTMIETTPIDEIQNGPWGLGDLLCRFVHNGYHLGQITKMREIAGW